MRKIHLLLALLFISLTQLPAQTLTPEVIASGGEYVSSGGYSLSQTFGEMMVVTSTTGASILTQGFQQPQQGIVTGMDDVINSAVHLTVYPSPAKDILFVNLFSENDISYNLRITDALGKQISLRDHSPSAMNSSDAIDISMLHHGFYFLTVTSSDSKFVKTVTFNKN